VSSAYASSNPALMTVSPNISSVRTAGWSTLIRHEIEINFGTEDSARFFFNSSSQLRFGGDIVGGSTPNSLAWATMMSTMGQVCLGATSTTQTGSGGTGSALGYRTLTTTYQTIFSQSPSAPYNADSLVIQARVENVTAINGANGSIIRVLISFNDNSTGTLDGTLTSRTFVFKPDSTQITIGDPLFTTVEGVDGNAGLTYFVFNQTITTQVTNYNLLNAAQAAGYTGTIPLYANVIVANGGSVVSNSTSSPSFLVPSLPTNSEVLLTISSGAVIAGRGGTGGTGAPSGVCGCQEGLPGTPGGPAMQLQYPCLLNNLGIIGGGGGGGGGGGAECSYIWNASAGGGGGGAGFGPGGGNNHCGVTAGRFGSPGQTGGLTTGGPNGGRGNTFTANGGPGGNIGQAGQQGQTIDAAGGLGGSAGAALTGSANLVAGSNLGDIRGSVS
jgi:hypothetical protein